MEDVYSVSINGSDFETAPMQFDHHCPLMGSGLNYTKSKCEMRQRDKTQRECFGGCKAERSLAWKNREVDERGKRRALQWKEIIRLINSGLHRKEIAKMFDCDPNKISRIKCHAKKEGLIKCQT